MAGVTGIGAVAGCGAGAEDETVGVWTVGVGVDGLTGVDAAGRGYYSAFENSDN